MSLAIDGGTRPGTITTPPPSAPPPPQDARAVVTRATDPKTGAVDTKQLGQWIADAAKTSPEQASAAYAEIESQLGAGDASRFAADTAAAMRGSDDRGSTYSATGAGLAPGLVGRRVLRDNPILEVQWRSTVSPVTGKSGFSGPLQQAMKGAGIRYDIAVNEPPVGGTAVNTPSSRTVNGNAARDAIAEQMRNDPSYTKVQNEADGKIVRQTSLGERHIDVTGTRHGARPKNNVRVDVESKLGFAARSTGPKGNLTQVMKDGERITENVKVRNFGAAFEGVGKVARPVGLAIDAVQLGSAIKADGGRFGDNSQRAAGSLVGGAAGAWGGAQAGAAIGSLGGPVGTVVGGLAGAAIGGIVGSGVGEKAVDFVKGWF